MFVSTACRYYGGVKLGKGGLYRAYGGCAREHLQASAESGYRTEHVPTVVVEYAVETASLGIFYHLLTKFNLPQLSCRDCESDNMTYLMYSIPCSQVDIVSAALRQNRTLEVRSTVIDNDS
jgi:putative IMPACT (imprinted ancient) family translation regulator